MAEYIERDAALLALETEGITKNMRAHRKVRDLPDANVAPVEVCASILFVR